MAGFDQHNDKHAEWLTKLAAEHGITGFYEVQDLADLMQGAPREKIGGTLSIFKAAQGLDRRDYIAWMRQARAINGVVVDEQWQAVEDAVRLKELSQ